MNFFVDVNCSNLCTDSFYAAQARFIFDMVGYGYTVHIYPMGGPIQNGLSSIFETSIFFRMCPQRICPVRPLQFHVL